MKERWLRIRAIILADYRARFRRTSTAVIFLLLCFAAYLWIPDPSTGRALLQINGQRALYNSEAIAMATALLCNVLVGLIGYYMVSNSIARDVRTRTGFIIASTTVKNGEYLLGIFLGNAIFLSAVIMGFMMSSMVMQIVRGEAALSFSAFLWQYLLVVPPMITFVSAIAVLFESIRWLSGRFGDFAYFWVWMVVLALVAVSSEKAHITWLEHFDTFGFAFVVEQIKALAHSDSLSIGASSFDSTKPPYVFSGLTLARTGLLPRITSTIFPISFLFVARLFFHRFDPTEIKASAQKAKHNLIARFNQWIRPLTVPLFERVGTARLGSGVANAVVTEALLTFQLYPSSILLLLGFAIASCLFSAQTILPALFASVVIVIAESSTRERQKGTIGMLYSLPRLKPAFVLWKVSSTVLLVLLFLFIPMVRILFDSPQMILSLFVGAIFLAGCATSLGLISGSPKTLIVTFLLFLYIVMNDGGKNPALDFAGWFGKANLSVNLTYLLLVIAMNAVAYLIFWWRENHK
jgi:hypothetical protein